MKILNRMGPNIEPCGIPDKSTCKTLCHLFLHPVFYVLSMSI